MGHSNGAAFILEQLLQRDLLYLPCRHHIFEIILADCFEQNLPVMSGPNVPLFKRFHDSWNEIDKGKYKNGLEGKTIIPNLSHKIEDIGKFIEEYLDQQLPRDDYKELLILSKVFIGIPCADVKFCKPGAYHHARWMAKAIHSLKIYLFREAFKLTHEEETSLFSICLFIVFVYIKHWFSAPLAIKAPIEDLQFIKDLFEYENIDSKTARSA